jgi:hypothetical protein
MRAEIGRVVPARRLGLVAAAAVVEALAVVLTHRASSAARTRAVAADYDPLRKASSG